MEGESDFTAELVAPGNEERNPPHQRKRRVYEKQGDDYSPALPQRQDCEPLNNGSFVFRQNLFFFFFKLHASHSTGLICSVQRTKGIILRERT